ncbi:hypothetical protein [Nostoc sp.]|uniref:hypothetical protein n=1 Tax=Nostoc sp. TaxID=1180 RepID=UPI002FEE9FDB
MYDGIVSDRLAENLKNNAIACCGRMCDRLTENLKNKAIALQKTSKIKRSLVWKSERWFI